MQFNLKASIWFVFFLALLVFGLLVERAVGLPFLFLIGWIQLATQLRLRWSLALSLGASLLVSAVYGVPWHWSFLIVWLGSWLINWQRPSPAVRWWRLLGWAGAGSFALGALTQLTSGVPLTWWSWMWPIFWLIVLSILRWRRYV
jgi:hypothetical protein